MDKNNWLSYIYYEIGKQQTNLKLTYQFIKDDQIFFSKWIPYLIAQEDLNFINKVTHRQQLINEIIFDLDNGGKKEFDLLISNLEKDNIFYYAYCTKNFRSKHIHTYWNKLTLLKKQDREKIREKIINKYNTDLSLKSDSHIIALEYCKHWKTGEIKELYKKNEGINDASKYIKDLEIELEKKNEDTLLSLFIENKEEISKMFYNRQPFFYDDIGIFWFWNFKKYCYEPLDEFQLMNKLKDLAKEKTFQITKNTFWNETIRSLKLIGRSKHPKEFNKKWIQFGKYVYNYETKEMFVSTHDYFNVNPLPYSLELAKSEETPIIDKLFEEWVGKDYVLTLKQTLALSIIQDYPLHRIICLFGKGLNGKGVFLRFLAKFIGKNNICSSNLTKLIKSNFESSKLYKKLVCIMGETDFSTLKDTSILKQITGQDLVSAEFKGKNGFDFQNFATLFIASNSLPISEDRTDGFYRRWLIIDFPNSFEEGLDPLNKIPEIEYNNLCLKIINILPDLINNGKFDIDGTIEERKKKYEEKSNPLNLYLEENYEKDINNDIPFFEFYDDFIIFCKERGFREVNKKKVSQLLEDLNYHTDKKDVKIGNKWTRWVYIFSIIKKKPKISTRSTQSTTISTPFSAYKREVEIGLERVERVETENVVSNYDKKTIIYHKCSIEDCKEKKCNLDSYNIPYCEKHWEENAQ